MGTNYYAYIEPCETCGVAKEVLHIGKSSAGWCFSLHVYPEREWWDGVDNAMVINDLDDWKATLIRTDVVIKDEYDAVIDYEVLLDRITNRSWERPSWEPVYSEVFGRTMSSGGIPGPNNLSRHEIDGRHCVGHGEGTWDYIIGDFS